MNSLRLIPLIQSDSRQIFRDYALWVFVFLPFIILSLLRWGLPVIEAYFAILVDYRLLIVAMMSSVSAVGSAYLISFIMLDEKDEQVFDALRVMPISPARFILYRLLLITGLGFVFAIFTIAGSGMLEISPLRILGLSFLISLGSPLTALACVSFAHNKIEGVTLLKGINFLFVIPMIVMILDVSWKWVFGFIPFYWVFAAFEEVMSAGLIFWLYLCIGVSVHLALIILIYSWFRKKVF